MNNSEYWDTRWRESDIDAVTFENKDIYPIKYADMVVNNKKDKILEIGCGLGRVVFHYKNQNYLIEGIERSKIAVERINKHRDGMKVLCGDALELPYSNSSFNVALAFGVYHNIEDGIETGISECARILEKNGKFCISMRPNNIEMNLNEMYWNSKIKNKINKKKYFHKILINESEFKNILMKYGLKTKEVFYGRNVSFLYRIKIFRDKNLESSKESVRRSKGYKLNYFGKLLDSILKVLFPYQTSNVIIFIGTKI